MSFFDDQFEAWMENDNIGDPTDYDDPYSILAVKAEREKVTRIHGVPRTQFLKARRIAFENEMKMSRNRYSKENGSKALRKWDARYRESLSNK